MYIDSYGGGDVADVVYDHERACAIMHGLWNSPFPMPADLSVIWKRLYREFEGPGSGDKNVSKKRKPIILGFGSDPGMFIDIKYKITQEIIKMLNYYDYPYEIITRTDLFSKNNYIKLINHKLCSIKIRVAGAGEERHRALIPGERAS